VVGVGGGGGGGGGSHNPNVTLTSRPILAPLGSVYLSQIPYTGLDLGPIGTAVYWLVLVIWSLAAAYLVLFGALPFSRRKLAGFGANVRQAVAETPVYTAPVATVRPMAVAVANTPVAPAPISVHQAVHAAAVVAAIAPVVPIVKTSTPARASEGFKSFATGDVLTIDDIVKGLSRESGMVFSQSEESAPYVAPAAHPMAYQAPHPEETDSATVVESYAAPTPVPAPAPVAVKPKTVAPAAAVSPEVPAFITAILDGERDTVFGIIRGMNQAGHDVEAFVSHTILALDDAYRGRIDGTPVHTDVKAVTDHLATPFLEKLVMALTTAVDGSYSMGVTGIKLALTRALAVSAG
jgi:hypothetical protein